MPTISDYNYIPISDGIKDFLRNCDCSQPVKCPSDPAEEIAAAVLILAEKATKWKTIAHTGMLNWKHHHPCDIPHPEVSELAIMAASNGWKPGSEEYWLCYFVEQYFLLLKHKKEADVLVEHSIHVLTQAIEVCDKFDKDHHDLKSWEDGYGVLLSVNEAYAILNALKNPILP